MQISPDWVAAIAPAASAIVIAVTTAAFLRICHVENLSELAFAGVARSRRVLFTLFVVIANVPLAGASGAEPPPRSALAPLDAYFGPLKLSAIEIRHRIDALSVRYHRRTISDGDLMHEAELLESAMAVWQRRYPHDSWIVPTIYHLEQLYQAVQTSDARAHATALLNFLIRTYPKTPQGRLSRVRLAQGFPPLHPETASHATPDPYASAAVPATATPASVTPNASDGSARPAAGTTTPAAGTAAPAHVPAPSGT